MPEFKAWRPEGHPVCIEYLAEVVHQVRRLSVEGLGRIKGGLEVGGILLGIHEDRDVRVLEALPLGCEYALGPRFSLSPKDCTELEKRIGEAAERGLEVVGWYHSVRQGEICLSARDLVIYDRYFPAPWQIVLVMRPAQLGPSQAGFFFREADGTVRANSSYEEFELETGPKRERPPHQAPIQPPRPQPPASNSFPPPSMRRTKVPWIAGALVLLILILVLLRAR